MASEAYREERKIERDREGRERTKGGDELRRPSNSITQYAQNSRPLQLWLVLILGDKLAPEPDRGTGSSFCIDRVMGTVNIKLL